MSLLIFGGAFVAGVVVYLLFFKRSEHHLYPIQYMQATLLSTATITITQNCFFDSPLKAAIKSSFSLVGLFLFGSLLSVSIYRLFFNPLNTIPGPYFARLTTFDRVFRNAKLDGHHQLNRLHKKYGRFVRVGPNDISVTDPDGVQIISGPQSKCTKSAWYDGDYPLQSMHTTRDKKYHDKRRRIWAPAFSDKALRGYEKRIQVYNDLLVKQIQAFSGKPLDASQWFNYYSFDVMGDLGFGSPFNMLISGEEHWAIKLLNEGMDPLGFMFPIWFFRTLISIPGLTAGYFKFITFCGQQIEERVKRQGKQEVQDVAHYLVDGFEKSEDKKKAMWRLHADSRLIIVAGSDTTAATLTHLFYHIAADSTIAVKLREELEPRIEGGEITNLKIQDAQYLNGCINEALRLNPPVPSGVFRKTPKEGVSIGDTFIPGDTTIQMPGYVIGHDNSAYPSAESFIPERWSTRPDLVAHKDAFQPFSSGPFGCIGKNLALMELRTLSAQLITLFDVSFAPGENGKRLLEKSTDHFTLGLQPLQLVFSKRK